jgi:hypothetical protein
MTEIKIYLIIGLLLTCVAAVHQDRRCPGMSYPAKDFLIEGAAITLFWPVAVAIGAFGGKHATSDCPIKEQ